MPTLEITEVASEPRTWTAKQGPAKGQEFLSYTVTAKDSDGEEKTYEISTKPTSPPPALGPDEFEIKPSQGDFPPKLKRIYQGSSNGSQGRSGGARDDYWQKREERDIESQARQGRAHAQGMALQWWALTGTNGAPALAGELSEIIDWFHKDVQRFPLDADGDGGNRAPTGDGHTDEGATASESGTTAAVSTGFVVKPDGSSPQKDFFDRLLKKRGFDSNQVEAINRFAETLPTDRVSKAMDGLNADDSDEADKAAAALLRLSDEWARKQSDTPWDEGQ